MLTILSTLRRTGLVLGVSALALASVARADDPPQPR